MAAITLCTLRQLSRRQAMICDQNALLPLLGYLIRMLILLSMYEEPQVRKK